MFIIHIFSYVEVFIYSFFEYRECEHVYIALAIYSQILGFWINYIFSFTFTVLYYWRHIYNTAQKQKQRQKHTNTWFVQASKQTNRFKSWYPHTVWVQNSTYLEKYYIQLDPLFRFILLRNSQISLVFENTLHIIINLTTLHSTIIRFSSKNKVSSTKKVLFEYCQYKTSRHHCQPENSFNGVKEKCDLECTEVPLRNSIWGLSFARTILKTSEKDIDLTNKKHLEQHVKFSSL